MTEQHFQKASTVNADNWEKAIQDEPNPSGVRVEEQPTITTHLKDERPASAAQPWETLNTGGPKHEEYQYLDLIRDCSDNGEFRPDRYVLLASSIAMFCNVFQRNSRTS
jgi:hypothetical protein